MKKIAIISDHAAFELKNNLKIFLEKKGYEVKDMGPENAEKPKNYALQGKKMGKWIAAHPEQLGIAMCGTGIGIDMAVNRIQGARSARVTSVADAKLAKKHNNANVLTMGGRITSFKKAVDMFNAFMREDFEGGRHLARLKALDK